MKQFFLKLYAILTEPLYQRLSLDLTTQVQNINNSHIEFQERFIKKLIDELLRLTVEVEKQRRAIESGDPTILKESTLEDTQGKQFSDAEIADIVRQIQDSGGAIELASRHGVPVATILLWQDRFARMHGEEITRARAIEMENNHLKTMLAELILENKSLKQSSTSQSPTASYSGQPTEASKFVGAR
jgi:regulator of replication initiation timing